MDERSSQKRPFTRQEPELTASELRAKRRGTVVDLTGLDDHPSEKPPKGFIENEQTAQRPSTTIDPTILDDNSLDEKSTTDPEPDCSIISNRKAKGPKNETDSTLQLCWSCQRLDIDTCFQKARKRLEKTKPSFDTLPKKATNGIYYYNDKAWAFVLDESLSGVPSCALCQFFHALRVQPGHKVYKLLAFPSSQSWFFRYDRLKNHEVFKKSNDTLFMAVVPHIDSITTSGYEMSWPDHDIPKAGVSFFQAAEAPRDDASTDLLMAQEVPALVDFGKLKAWLETCRGNHGKACQQRSSSAKIERTFRLVNCTKDPPEVEVRVWGTPYVALSYVWGDQTQDHVMWTETIRHATKVVKELGLFYLWVDRICIRQDDEGERNYMISRMDKIYENAEFTIVAATDGDPQEGLPGVASPRRQTQPCLVTNKGNILRSILPDPRHEIRDSKYWTRGWTYQEGVLSNRCIVFTKSQVYWECQCMTAQESAHLNIAHTSVKYGDETVSVMADYMLTGIFKGRVYSGGSSANDPNLIIDEDEDNRLDYGFYVTRDLSNRAQLRGLEEHIRAFSKRKLTKDTDSLVALQGVLNLYEEHRGLFVVLGLPVWTGNVTGFVDGARLTFALSVASWYHRPGPGHAMFISSRCKRRKHLPSWTWAGWEGAVSWRAPPNLEHASFMADMIHSEGSILAWHASINLHHVNATFTSNLFPERSSRHHKGQTIAIAHPMLLNSWERVEDLEPTRSWAKPVGRPGRESVTGKTADWDDTWFRIGKRLSMISMSIAMSERQWTDKHRSEDLISVLMFAGRYLDLKQHEGHGTARFLTLQRSASNTERWERVGTLYLIIPCLEECDTKKRLLEKIPVHRKSCIIVIQ